MQNKMEMTAHNKYLFSNILMLSKVDTIGKVGREWRWSGEKKNRFTVFDWHA